MALGDHAPRDPIRCTPLLAEDDALPDCQLIDRDEDFVFVLFALAIHIELPDRIGRDLVPF